MGNMSYCRFENTANDLADCVSAINSGEVFDLSSDYEIDGLRKLLVYAQKVVDNTDYIEYAINNQNEE